MLQTRNHLLCFVLCILCCSSSLSARNCFPAAHLPRRELGPVLILWSLITRSLLLCQWGGFWCSPQHPLNTTCPFHHLQELFHIVYVTFRAHISIFHQDPLIQTPGSIKTALITIHFEYISPQMTPSDHQCCVDTIVFPVDIDFFSCSIQFWAQAA